jgi:predicted XRE-type DNA-binding protein
MAGKRKAAEAESVTVTRKSAFHALGLENADDLVLRAHLIWKVGQAIKLQKLSQAAIGAKISMDQPRVSALLAGKIWKFSTDRLVTILMTRGQDVEVRVRPSRNAQGELRLSA